MAITNITSGADVATTTTTLTLVAPTVVGDDIMIAFITANNNSVITPPASWALIRQDNNTAAMRTSCYWKRAAGNDSASNNAFTVAGATVSYGIIGVWRGCIKGGSPIGNTTVSANALSDTVTYATVTPRTAYGAIIAFGAYNLSATTAGAIAGTDPTLSNIVDVETATGNTASIFIYWGTNSGIATGARTHATTSTVDAINTGTLIELIAQNDTGGGSGGGSARFPSRVKDKVTRSRISTT